MGSTVPGGAYGLHVIGAPAGELLPLPASTAWTRVTLSTVVQPAPPTLHGIGAATAAFALLDGAWAVVDRAAGTAVRGAAEPADPTGLVHPFLAAVGAVHAAWAGRAALHAGAWAATDGAWLLTGPSGTGKSTTLAVLAAAGARVVADDLAVLDAGTVLAGPRGIDLRPHVARELGAATRPVRGGLRERLALDAVAPGTPLLGIVHLEWARDGAATLDPARPAERLARLGREDLWAVPAPGAGALLDLAALPGFVLRRPRGLDGLARAVDLLAALG